MFDGFTEFSSTGSSEQLNGIGAFKTDYAIAVGGYGDIIYTTDAGSTWNTPSSMPSISDNMFSVNMASATLLLLPEKVEM